MLMGWCALQAEKYDLTYFEVSAKTGLNLEDAFGHIAETYHKNYCSFVEQATTVAVDS